MNEKQVSCVEVHTMLNEMADLIECNHLAIESLDMNSDFGALIRKLECIHDAVQSVFNLQDAMVN